MKILLLSLLLLVGCGNKPKVFEGKVYNCYGFMDKNEEKDSRILYEIDGENAFGAFLFSETVIIPFWTLGYNIYCPVEILKLEE